MTARDTPATRRPSRVMRWWLRAPLALYRFRIGRFALGELMLWLYGHPHIRVAHRGRRTGQRREVVLEVLARDAEHGELYVAAMWGPGSDWLRNLAAAPVIEVEFRGRRWCPAQRLLPDDEAQRVLDDYRRRHRVWSGLAGALLRRPFTAAAMPVVGFSLA